MNFGMKGDIPTKVQNRKHVTGTLEKRWLRGFVGPLYFLVHQSFDAKDLSYDKYPFLTPGNDHIRCQL